jgi:hypothetical protein
MKEMITIPRSEYERMKAEFAELRSLVQQLTEEIALLKNGRNSKTSSTDPSHDIGRSNLVNLRSKSDRKSGGQTGHSGHTLLMKETPDAIIEHVSERCSGCGTNLEAVTGGVNGKKHEKALTNEWSILMKDLFHRAIELKKRLTAQDYRHPPKEVRAINDELDELLKVDISGFHIKLQAFVTRLIKNRESILTFLTHPDVPYDNNGSERAIRMVKVKTKVSGQFRNKEGKGADRFARIRSVIGTTIKNGQNVYPALLCLAKC